MPVPLPDDINQRASVASRFGKEPLFSRDRPFYNQSVVGMIAQNAVFNESQAVSFVKFRVGCQLR